MELHQDKAIRLNIGAGSKSFEGWTNVGYEHEVKCDVRQIPLPDNYAEEAMAIHVLEHINRWEALDTLKEWRRVLKPGAMLAVEVPDLIKCCKAVLTNPDERMGMWGLYGDPHYKDELMVHRWGYSQRELMQLFLDAGFKKVKAKPVQFHKAARDMRIEGRK